MGYRHRTLLSVLIVLLVAYGVDRFHKARSIGLSSIESSKDESTVGELKPPADWNPNADLDRRKKELVELAQRLDPEVRAAFKKALPIVSLEPRLRQLNANAAIKYGSKGLPSERDSMKRFASGAEEALAVIHHEHLDRFISQVDRFGVSRLPRTDELGSLAINHLPKDLQEKVPGIKETRELFPKAGPWIGQPQPFEADDDGRLPRARVRPADQGHLFDQLVGVHDRYKQEFNELGGLIFDRHTVARFESHGIRTQRYNSFFV